MTPHNHCYEFGPYQLDLAKRVLLCDGETIPLTPKATEILIKLVSNAGQVVEKDHLLKEVWPNTFVEEANLSQNIFTLRKALRDDRNEPKYIETIAKRAYRFVGTVKGNTTVSTSRPVIVDSINVIAVLPFINRTATEDLEHLAEGLTDNVINSLSRLPKLRVMSKSALSRYKTKDLDPREIGRQLGVNAVLVGNVNAQPPGVSITAELVDVSTGWQLWGEVFNSPTTGLHEVKEEVTLQVRNALKQKLIPEEDKKKHYPLYGEHRSLPGILGRPAPLEQIYQGGNRKRDSTFSQSHEIDPNYALGYAAIIDCYLRLTTNYLPPDDLSEPPGVTFYETVGKEKQWDDPVKLRSNGTGQQPNESFTVQLI